MRDSLISVYIGPKDTGFPDNQIVISSAKLRRSGGIPIFYAGVNADVGLVTNLVTVNIQDKEIHRKLADDAF